MMGDKKDNIAVVLAKLNLGADLSDADVQVLGGWIQSSEANKRLYEELTDDNKVTRGVLELMTIDLDEEWAKIAPSANKKPGSLYFSGRKLFWAAVAAAIGIISIGEVWLRGQRGPAANDHSGNIQVENLRADVVLVDENGSEWPLRATNMASSIKRAVTSAIPYSWDVLLYPSSGQPGVFNEIRVPAGRQFTVRLADESAVTLFGGSSLRFPCGFPPDTMRRVQLRGQAQFSVTASASRPFLIDIPSGQHCKAFTVEVLGTTLLVDAANPRAIKTRLITGAAKVRMDTKTIVLRAGTTASIDCESHQYSEKRISEGLATDSIRPLPIIRYSEVRIRTFLTALAEVHDVEFKYESEPEGLFTGGLNPYGNLDSLMSALQKQGALRFIKTGDRRYLIHAFSADRQETESVK